MRDKTNEEIAREYEFLLLLKKKENDENLQIMDFKEVPGCKPGDNFMSVIIRIELKGIYGNGNPFEKTFIKKLHPTDHKLVTLVRTKDLFCNEAHLYTEVLPALEAESFAPECYYANFEKIIMEDLARDNFSVCDRRELLDYKHCRHVVQALAQFHACSLKLKFNNAGVFESLIRPISEVVFPSGTDSNFTKRQSVEKGVKLAIQSLEIIEPQTEEIQRCIKFLKSNLHQVYDMIRQSSTEQSTYDVLNHGDLWNNNILFSHDSKNKEIKKVKFVDFQGIRKASPALDFHYFMYSSAKSTVLENHYKELVQLYHQKFLRELESQIPEMHYEFINFDWFKNELHQHAAYGLFSALCLVHVLLADDESIKISVSENGEEFDTKIPITAKKAKRIEKIVSHFLNTFGNAY